MCIRDREYCSFPERSECELANWLIEQGVDHVIGSHPHVLQPMEIVKDEEYYHAS